MPTAASTDLTYTETVVLHAHRFSPSQSDGGFPSLLAPGSAVATAPLAGSLMVAALLANEQTGTLRLQAAPKKTWFGLRTVTALFVHPTGHSTTWPEGSWEARVLAAANRLAPRGKNDAMRVAYEAIGSSGANPELDAVEDAVAPLRRRQLVEQVTTETVRLKVLKKKEKQDVLTAAGQEAARAQDPEAVKRVIEEFLRARPEEYALLLKDVALAFAGRTHDSGSSDFGSPD